MKKILGISIVFLFIVNFVFSQSYAQHNSDSKMKCSEYYNKLISEGWKVVEQDETDAILEKDGIRKHVYLLADTHTYKIDNVDSQAYWTCSGFDNNNIEFTSDQYNAIDGDDDNYVLTTCDYESGGSGTRSEYTYNKFVTTIDENIDDISQIDILSKGFGSWYTAGMRYRYELWVKESGTWEQKDSHSSSGKDTVSISYTSGFSDIISSSKIIWGLKTGGWIGTGTAHIRLYAYYGEVVVTYSSPTTTRSTTTITPPELIHIEGSGFYTINKPTPILIYIKNNAKDTPITCTVSVSDVHATYKGNDVSHLVDISLQSNEIVVPAGETKATQAIVNILGPIEEGTITFSADCGDETGETSVKIRSGYPINLPENSIVIVVIIFSSMFVIFYKELF
ncbi:MAG: hypothetical protein J7J93_02065 [Candidatus Aenigmarchaeota archaeon]|nr:hypothetical protein [Candidatus Aenigmarchaeota archaeon]